LGLAIPSRAVNEFLVRPSPPRLGVSVRSVKRGLLLLEVESGAAAEQASLRAGDILVGADGRRFTSPDALPDVIERGGAVRLQFLRGSRDRVREAPYGRSSHGGRVEPSRAAAVGRLRQSGVAELVSSTESPDD
jgi:S1-C subfamily serine protease